MNPDPMPDVPGSKARARRVAADVAQQAEDELSALARAFREGEEAAFDRLQAQVRERLYRLAYRLTGNTEDALDVVQDALVKVYRGVEAWNERSAFYSWLYRVTANLAIDRLRRRAKVREVRRQLRQHQPGTSPDPVPELVERRQIEHDLRRLREAVESLPAAQRAIVVLRHYEGLSLREIAEVRGCALGTVKSTLHQAFHNLRRAMEGAVREAREHGRA
ncbi:MAG: hypothetical protein KatS3mg102_3011 [Planctomycetota bacterium]|nr:MAG: hypothetical protein KatS3mg102_3011 [Planctomycetota bacterium]